MGEEVTFWRTCSSAEEVKLLKDHADLLPQPSAAALFPGGSDEGRPADAGHLAAKQHLSFLIGLDAGSGMQER